MCDWVSACRDLEVEGAKGKGRSRKMRNKCVNVHMKLLGFTRENVLGNSLTSGYHPTLHQSV